MTQLPRTTTFAERSYEYDPTARVMSIVTSGVLTAYDMVELDDGGYRLVKVGGTDAYDVTLGVRPQLDVCTCPAGRWGKPCKHVAAVRDLAARSV